MFAAVFGYPSYGTIVYGEPLGFGTALPTDTHDGFVKKKHPKVFLPEYFKTLEEIPPVIPEQYRFEPNIDQPVPEPLIKYDIDWDLVAEYSQVTGQKLQNIIKDIEISMREYERRMRMDEDDFIIMALAAIN